VESRFGFGYLTPAASLVLRLMVTSPSNVALGRKAAKREILQHQFELIEQVRTDWRRALKFDEFHLVVGFGNNLCEVFAARVRQQPNLATS